MHIRQINIEGFKRFRKFELKLNEHLNIIVGDNEPGKTTLREAINLVLSCQIDGRSLHKEISPYIFNHDMVNAISIALAMVAERTLRMSSSKRTSLTVQMEN
jgi:putative ATP-dependent endonuclease of the OLD family